jgi:hypothetical protein
MVEVDHPGVATDCDPAAGVRPGRGRGHLALAGDGGHARASWLGALRTFLALTIAGNLVWETLQLPLYTIWRNGSVRDKTFAVIHCTLGDILIALAALVLALVLAGDERWPANRFWRVAALSMMFGVAYTIFSEWLNVVVRAAWAYSDWMPIVPLFGLRVGLSPLTQWVVVPSVSFAITSWRLESHS